MVDGDANRDNLRASTTSSDGRFEAFLSYASGVGPAPPPPPPKIFEDKNDVDARLPPLDSEVDAYIGGDTIDTDESSNDSLVIKVKDNSRGVPSRTGVTTSSGVNNAASYDPRVKYPPSSFTNDRGNLEPRELKRRKACSLHWWHAIFLFSGISVLICLLEILLPSPQGMRMTSAEVVTLGIALEGCEDGLKRCICPRETVCATDIISMVLLTIARCSAFFDYPLYMMIFLSKCHNLNNILRRTIMRELIDFADMHCIHSIFGIVIAVESTSHSFFHVIRWGINNDIDLLWKTQTGVTGAIGCAVTAFIVWPMCIPRYIEKKYFI
jgi:hypothetical protein